MLIIYFILPIAIISIFLLIISIFMLLKTRVPFVSLSHKRISEIFDAVKLEKGKLFYDLGCGDARVLIEAYKKYGIKGVGYEINLWAYLRAKIKTYKYRDNIKIYYKDFLKESLDNPDYIFAYLMPPVMESFGEKLKNEIDSPCHIICCAFHIPNMKPSKVFKISLNKKHKGSVYVYDLPRTTRKPRL